MSTLKVDGIRSNSASSDAITLANDGTCTANITNRSNRNLIINGAMQVAQRGTSSSTDTNGYHTVDRFKPEWTGIDNAITQAQVDVASGTTPYTLGFRKSFKMTNGNQTGGAGAGDYLYFRTTLEAQDIANSGWNYTSASSYITLSFWIKSSVAQNFYGYLRTHDGTNYHYPFETGSLSADTWTKVTKTIAGNSNLQFDNDQNAGLQITWLAYFGTGSTSSGASLNAWQSVGGGDTYTPDNTTTWYTTNDATLELTGVQLEVGSVATDFEHRSYADELRRCQRYYYRLAEGLYKVISENCSQYNSNYVYFSVPLPIEMRSTPSLDAASSSGYYIKYANDGDTNFSTLGLDGVTTPRILALYANVSGTAGHACMIRTSNSSTYVAASSEL